MACRATGDHSRIVHRTRQQDVHARRQRRQLVMRKEPQMRRPKEHRAFALCEAEVIERQQQRVDSVERRYPAGLVRQRRRAARKEHQRIVREQHNVRLELGERAIPGPLVVTRIFRQRPTRRVQLRHDQLTGERRGEKPDGASDLLDLSGHTHRRQRLSGTLQDRRDQQHTQRVGSLDHWSTRRRRRCQSRPAARCAWKAVRQRE